MSGIGLVTATAAAARVARAARWPRACHGLYKVFYVPLSTATRWISTSHRLGDGARRRAQPRRALPAIKNEVTRLATETRTRPILLLDEAHLLRSDVLEEMRF